MPGKRTRNRPPILAVSLTLIVLIVTATGWDIHSSYRAHQHVVERQMGTLADAAAAQVETSIRAIDLMLEDAAKSVDTDHWPDKQTVARLQARLAAFPEIRNFAVVDADGRMVGPHISRQSVVSKETDVSDREYFRYVRDHWREASLYIAAPVVSRLHDQPTLPVARPLRPRDGGFAGLAVVGVTPAFFETVLRSVVVDEGASAALLRADGIFLTRYPEGARFGGRSVPDRLQFGEMVRSGSGVVQLPSLRDKGYGLEDEPGMDRLIAYRSLAHRSLVVTATLPVSVAFRQWRLRARQSATVVLVLSATVLLLALLLQRHVTERTELLRRLAVEGTLGEERERRAIAADLHDDLGQTLHVARIKLGTLAKTLPAESPGGSLVHDVKDLIAEASRAVRTLTSQLSPPALKDLGLVAALSWLAEEMERVYGLGVAVDDDGLPKPLTQVQSAILFRAVRELLINVSKHAGADRARVDLRAGDGRLQITVTDEGLGMADWRAAMQARRGFGLASVRERLTFLKGRMDIRPHPGGGTEVMLDLPFDPHPPPLPEIAS